MIVGRDRELAAVEALLSRAREGRSGALCLVGDAGAGKTTLLEAAEGRAEGFTVLRATGFEAETSLAHAGLLEALGPVLDRLDALPPAQADALNAALGRAGVDGAGDRYLVAAAVLALLARAAEERPVLLLVDDLQWLDQESAAALAFAARRLTHDPTAVLLAARTGVAADRVAGTETVYVEGLAVPDAERLLHGQVARRLVPRLVDVTGGNPLALLETGRRLSPAQRTGTAPLPEDLPVGTRLLDAFGAEVRALPVPGRRAAVILAAAGDADTGTVAAALAATDQDPVTALDERERAGAAVRGGASLRFRHPLLRAAAWALATPAERRQAHLALASAVAGEPQRAVRHRAEAAVGRDDGLAEELADVADVARARRGYAAASALMVRSAALTTDRAVAGRRAAHAVEDAATAGDVTGARSLARTVLAEGDDAARGHVLAVLGELELYSGSVPRGRDLLAEAAGLAEGAYRVRALASLADACYLRDDRAGMLRAAQDLYAAADPSDTEQLMLAEATLGSSLVFSGDLLRGRTHAIRALELVESEARLRDDPRHLITALLLARWAGDLRKAAHFADRRIRRARELGALGVLPQALAFMAAGAAFMGDHERAYADAGEAAELGAELDYAAIVTIAHEILAVEAAARGLHDVAAAALAESRRLTERAGVADVAQALPLAEALCAVCRGDAAEVVRLLERRVAVDGGRDTLDDPFGVAPDLVESYVALGRSGDARAAAQRYAELHAEATEAHLLARRSRVLALAEPDDSRAVASFRTAVTAAEEAGDPFEVARTRLLLGGRLRRAGERRAARDELRVAREAFAAMGLDAWTARTEDELAASGETAVRRRRNGEQPLTSRETRVALLVAEGLTNREIAAALFVSPKTVEHHVGAVLRKRGLRSRTELAASLARGGGVPLPRGAEPT